MSPLSSVKEAIKRCLPAAVLTRVRLRRNRSNPKRRLEIGPGDSPLEGFETLDITRQPHVDYVWNAARPLPFEQDTFVEVYASHVLEHVAWYQVETTLREWTRILKPGGWITIVVPDGLKVCKTLVDAELHGTDATHLDGWYKFNPEKDPCVWAAARFFTFGDGTGDPASPNWHRALFTPRYLRKLLTKFRLEEVRQLKRHEIRGFDHGWISLAMTGRKPCTTETSPP